MKKVALGLLLALGALFALTIGVSAAPEMVTSTKPGPFHGKFQGTVYGDKGTKAKLSLDLDHRGNKVEGKVFLGEGLFVDAGMCGSGYVPAGSQFAVGQTSTTNPQHLDAQSTFTVNGIKVNIDLDGDISSSGDQIKTKAKIDLPWICGRDPIISGTLNKA